MSFTDTKHLLVTSVQTEDGLRPKLDEKGQQMYKETQLPLTAKRHMEKRNALLPNHLKMKIEVVEPTPEEPAVEPVTPGAKDVSVLPGTIRPKRFSTL